MASLSRNTCLQKAIDEGLCELERVLRPSRSFKDIFFEDRTPGNPAGDDDDSEDEEEDEVEEPEGVPSIAVGAAEGPTLDLGVSLDLSVGKASVERGHRSKRDEDKEWDLDSSYINMVTCERTSKAGGQSHLYDINRLLQKSVIVPGFEKLHSIPPYSLGKKRLQAERRKEREQTKGKNWFHMRPPEMTEEIRHDLQLLQMRSVLDPKHFYKKNDLQVLPKYFQVGHVLDSPADFYSSRLTKRERKQTIVEELLADADFKNYNKRRYREITEERRKTSFKAFKQAKKIKWTAKNKK